MKRVGSLVEGRKEIFFVESDQTVMDVARYMVEKRVGAVPVLSNGQLVGIFSERDLMTRVIVAGLSAETTKVGEVMTREVLVADASESHDQCIRKMQQRKCRHLPVLSGGKLLGVVSLRDLLQVDLSEKDGELKMMSEYIHYVPEMKSN